MFTCPNCGHRLNKTFNAHGVHWTCDRCAGRAVGIALLRYARGDEAVRHLLRATSQPGVAEGKSCPVCSKATREVVVPEGFVVDVCRPCNFVWFDATEIALPPKPVRRPPEPKVASEGEIRMQQLMARERFKELSKEAQAFEPDLHDWRTLPAVFGMPVEIDRVNLQREPVATWAVLILIALASVASFGNLEWAVERFGLVPADWLRGGGITLASSFFLHAGWLHLLGNLYFLLNFGDNVEDYLGRRRFLLLLASATLAGHALHIALDPAATVPCIGASGGISGLIAFYALKFPQARLGWLFRIYVHFKWVRLPVWGWFCLWMFLQLLGLLQQMSGLSRVSSAAHLGGVLAGFGFWLLWRNRF
jgi:membrane associated rhomboid family serine protease/Zn-finger nucleic acid-binding protein